MENHNNVLSDRYRQLAAQLAGIEPLPAAKKSASRQLLFISNKEVRNDAT